MKLIPYNSKKRRTMQRNRARSIVGSLFVLAFVMMAAPAVYAQSYPLFTPVHIGTSGQIVDEFGNLLRGSSAVDASKRDLVQILWASNSVINPPAFDGTPHANNAPVDGGTFGIGNLVSPNLVTPGRFAASLARPRPPQNSKIFVRVFNAPTLEEASFYADSQLMVVRNNDLMIAEIAAADQPIDPRDDDGDGLNNSWEKSLYTDPNDWDSDDDGMCDGDERIAGTDMLDRDSVFVAVWLESDVNQNAVLTWHSVPGKNYQVDFIDLMGARTLSYSNVSAVVSADDWQTQTTITNGLSSGSGKYRVKVVD